jgi:hypothetical protein
MESSLPKKKSIDAEIHLSKDDFDKLPDLAKDAITASGIPLSVTASVDDKMRKFAVRTATVDKPQDLASMLGTLRWDWGQAHGDVVFRLNWGVVNAGNAVFVAIGEGAAGGPTAGKFIGGAKFTLFNVAPRDGGVDIWININWGSDLRIYVDYQTVSIDQFGP